jgi:hypothetical protein
MGSVKGNTNLEVLLVPNSREGAMTALVRRQKISVQEKLCSADLSKMGLIGFRN